MTTTATTPATAAPAAEPAAAPVVTLTEAEAKEAEAKRQNNARSRAYADAEKVLRDRHAEEFAELYAQACQRRGIAYRPRTTGEQKARETVDTLLGQYPDLAQELLKTLREPKTVDLPPADVPA